MLKDFGLWVLPNLVMVKIFTLQRRFCNKKVKVINVLWVVTAKISHLYYTDDVNAVTAKSTRVECAC